MVSPLRRVPFVKRHKRNQKVLPQRPAPRWGSAFLRSGVHPGTLPSGWLRWHLHAMCSTASNGAARQSPDERLHSAFRYRLSVPFFFHTSASGSQFYQGRNMHLWATNMPPKHVMITPSLSSPQVRLRPLTNTQGKPDTALYIAFAGRKHACPCMYFSAGGGC
jgi:hypothetical protein